MHAFASFSLPKWGMLISPNNPYFFNLCTHECGIHSMGVLGTVSKGSYGSSDMSFNRNKLWSSYFILTRAGIMYTVHVIPSGNSGVFG